MKVRSFLRRQEFSTVGYADSRRDKTNVKSQAGLIDRATYLLALFAAVILSSEPLLAETELAWGVKGGISLAKSSDIESQYRIDVESITGPVVGCFAVVNVTDYLAIQPELLYVQMGSKQSWSLIETTYQGVRYHEFRERVKLHYFEIPVQIKVRAPRISGFTPSLSVGPVMGIMLGAKTRIETSTFDSNGELVEQRIHNWDIGGYYKGTDFGITLGGDLEMNVRFARVIFDGRYFLGLMEIDKSKVELDSKVGTTLAGDTKNKAISFTLGLVFPLKL